MALNKNVFRIQFGRGLDTKSTDIVLEPGSLENLENAVIEKLGRLEKEKALLLLPGIFLQQIIP